MTPESYREHIETVDPTPCAACTACCRNGQAVQISPEHGDNPDDYPHKAIENLAGEYHLVLGRKPNGDCMYVTAKGCSIHDKRPATCRAFDCRRQFKLTPKALRREMVELGVFNQKIFDAGKKRQHTLKLLEGEEQLGRDMSEFVVDRARYGVAEGYRRAELRRRARR